MALRSAEASGGWVDVTVRKRDGRFMATADLGEGSRDVGVGDTPQHASTK